MFSCPPAITIVESPDSRACLPIATALKPEPHTMFIVLAGTDTGRPLAIAAWRAGF